MVQPFLQAVTTSSSLLSHPLMLKISRVMFHFNTLSKLSNSCNFLNALASSQKDATTLLYSKKVDAQCYSDKTQLQPLRAGTCILKERYIKLRLID